MRRLGRRHPPPPAGHSPARSRGITSSAGLGIGCHALAEERVRHTRTRTQRRRSWTFKRVGFWQTRATVREDGAARDVASFEHYTVRGGGTLRLADGRSLLVTTNFWQTHIEFRLSEDRLLFRYRTEGFPPPGGGTGDHARTRSHA